MDEFFTFILGALFGAIALAVAMQMWLYGDEELFLDEAIDDFLVMRAIIRLSKITDTAERQLLDTARRLSGSGRS